LNQELLNKLKQIFYQLSTKQKVAFAALTTLAILSLFVLFVWVSRPEYALLYSKLEPGDAAQIIDDLKAGSIPYKLEAGGTTIMVPKKQIYELRLRYAGQNLISSGHVGYELFDNQSLGMTDFMQKVNLKRALEGELANTINQIESIVQSRVHLVIPERTLYEEEQKKATASVIVKLKPRVVLERAQINGIAQLVSGSVEGLNPENVIIVDTFGKVLSKNESRNDDIGLSSSQYELQKNVEKYLSSKAQTMLDQVLGANNAIVRVNATLNFEKVSHVSVKIDPDNVAVLSEEKNEERSTGTDTTNFQRENTVTNYEFNKVTEQYQNSVGDIKHLSVAVFVNGVSQVNATNEEVNVPRSDEEISIITEIVRAAVGFNAERNDQISVQQLVFDQSTVKHEREVIESIQEKENIMNYVKLGIMIVAALFVLFMLRSVFRKVGIDEYLKKQKEELLGEAQKKLETSEIEEEFSMEEQNRAKKEAQDRMTKEVKEFTSKETERASRILRTWLVENEDE